MKVIKINSRLKKALAVFLLCNILNQVFFPCISMALTSGPTAPEATSFEPVDTTDMVNPLTGDFTYNVPLLEVPGPEGSYPLSLSYHAGIQPNEEASWVGLGWTMGPGAISRSVNGYPDDFSDVNNITRSYWSGGETKQVGVDVGIGFGPVSVNFGLSFSQDTYQGFGIGSSIGVGVGGAAMGLGQNSPFNFGITVGTSPYGDSYAGLNIGLSTAEANKEAINLGASIGVSTNFHSSSVGTSASVSSSDGKGTSTSLLGASMNSSGGGVSFTAGGIAASVKNANEGRIQTESSGWSFVLPLPGVSIGVSNSYKRYWSDETASVLTNGSLYSIISPSNNSVFNDHAYDNYRLLDAKRADRILNGDPDRLTGGTYPDFDNYNVSAQGLSGNMRPYAYNNLLYTQNRINNQDHSNDVKARIITSNKNSNPNYGFRFMNDFSNSYRQDGLVMPDEVNFLNTKYGNNDGDFGYSASKNQLAGSKHIEWFTNSQISSGEAYRQKGFINTNSTGINDQSSNGADLTPRPTKGQSVTPPATEDKRIGGFMITNASGVTYHYALPAYSFNEYTYTEAIGGQGQKWNNLCRPKSYAYTWYLTAVTGPDYVDRNGNGFVDDEDWGYWVEFNYGKWSDNYAWRNPSEGFHKDIDNDFKIFSLGQKEVYYLNTIKTRTHTAVFVKEVRADSKSVTYFNEGGFDVIPKQTGSTPVNFTALPSGSGTTQLPICKTPMNVRYPVSSLKLKEVVLLKNEDYASIGGDGISTLSNNYNFSLTETVGSSPVTTNFGYGKNVIDVFDIKAISNFNALKINSIEFNYDYSLSKGTPNSFDETGALYSNPSVRTEGMERLGKLTLNSIGFAGRGGVKSTPPISFDYDLDPSSPENKDQIKVLTDVKQIQFANESKFQPGDIVKFNINAADYYALVLSKSGSIGNVKYLDKIPSGQTAAFIDSFKTKNPPYNKDAVDMWGMYKSDYNSSISDENIKKTTTPLSAKSIDVWSLRQITSILGAKINIGYESDEYSKSALSDNTSIILSNAVVQGAYVKLTVKPLPTELKVEEMYTKDKLMDVHLFCQRVNFRPDGQIPYCSKDPIVFSTIENNVKAKIVDVGPNWVLVKHDEMRAFLTDQDSWRNIFLTGNMDAESSTENFGGGLKVVSISTSDPVTNTVNRTKYNYNYNLGPSSVARSSGVTTFEPMIYPYTDLANFKAEPYFPCVVGGDGFINTIKNQYKSFVYRKLNYLLAISREVPPPGVMYSNVTVENEIKQPDGLVYTKKGKTFYEYQVFNAGMIGVYENYYAESNNVITTDKSIKNYTSRVGNLKRMITYDDHGNKLTETRNSYLHDGISENSFNTQVQNYDAMLSNYKYQGLIQEKYGDSRTVMDNNTAITKTILSGRDSYPSIQIGTTQIDYKNGVTINQSNLGFDFYSGSITKTLNSDSYGNLFVNEVVPAYTIYPSMGLKVNETSLSPNKNMLTQVASSTTYKVNFSNQPTAVISATANTWSNTANILDGNDVVTTYGQSNIWRPKAHYTWMSDGNVLGNVTPFASFVGYFNGGSSNASWKKTSENTLFNVFSNQLEGVDINGHYSAVRSGYKNSKIIVSSNPSKYEETTFSGAEDAYVKDGSVYFGGNVKAGTATVVDGIAHTGYKSLVLNSGAKAFLYSVSVNKLTKRNYSVAVWVKPQATDISGMRLYYQIDNGTEVANTPTFDKKAGGWYLLEMKIPASVITGTSLIVGCKNIGTAIAYADDFRFQPSNAQSKAYVYDKLSGQLTHILDNNNLFVKFEYDAAGRLIKTYKEVIGKANIPLIKETSYNYGLTK